MKLLGYIILALLATSFVGSAQDESTVYAYEVDPDTGWALESEPGWMLTSEPLDGYFSPYHTPGFPEPIFCGLLKIIFGFQH